MESLSACCYHVKTRQYIKPVFLLTALLLYCGANPIWAGESFALVGATLIDGNSGVPVTDTVVIIEDSIIKAVGPTSSTNIPAETRIIDVAGLSILPGLIRPA